MREIKFRCWDGREMKPHFDISQNPIYWEGFIDGALMQYTGLKDKNGIEIYEGDIVNLEIFRNNKPFLIIGKIEYLSFGFEVVGINKFRGLSYEINGIREVIGNIYENKELLEEVK